MPQNDAANRKATSRSNACAANRICESALALAITRPPSTAPSQHAICMDGLLTAFFGWPISCITWAAGASPGAATRDGVGLMLTSKSRLGQATEAINDHLRCNDAEAHARIIVIAVMASARVAR